MNIKSNEPDCPLVPFVGLAWIFAVVALSEFRLLNWKELFLTSIPASIVLGAFALGMASFFLQRLVSGRYRIAIREIFVLIAFFAIAFSNPPIFAAVGATALAIDSFALKSAKTSPQPWLVLIERAGAVLGSVYAGASFVQLMALRG